MNSNSNPLQTFCAVALNLVVPGAGLVVQGRLRWAIYSQLALNAVLMALCWTRLVFEPLAIQVSIVLIVLIYLASSLLCIKAKTANSASRSKLVIQVAGFIVISFTIWSAGFAYKQHWLGTEIYFVPSDSMTPTLKPGEFILVDSWAYNKELPGKDDVVVFLYSPEKEWLVKRVGTWPGGSLIESDQYYLLGDNSPSSRDSRYFGGISKTQIVGQVKLVLLGIDHNHQILPGSLFRMVN